MPTTFDCIICTGTHTNKKIRLIEASPVCHDCITSLFTRAVENERNYPPTWGDRELTLEMFEGIVPIEVSKTFQEKEAEYLTPPEERIYCVHVEGNKEGQEACGKYPRCYLRLLSCLSPTGMHETCRNP